jgi:hypothetical protein
MPAPRPWVFVVTGRFRTAPCRLLPGPIYVELPEDPGDIFEAVSDPIGLLPFTDAPANTIDGPGVRK